MTYPADFSAMIAQANLRSWLSSALGPFKVASDHTRAHPGQRASLTRLRTAAGDCFVKLHRDRFHWENEVHAYERWAPAFGDFAPRLLAVHDQEPLALVISALPGTALEETSLPPAQELAAWRAAGQALPVLHASAAGEYFGPCRRDGSCAGAPLSDAVQYLTHELGDWEARGLRANFLTPAERAIVRSTRDLLPAFAGEPPAPCHRDYCAANWLVSSAGAWTGVIDFEFAYWDVAVADLARDPGWNWIRRPDLPAAFLEGYGRAFTPREEDQLFFARALYALTAIVWGEENDYHGFAAEGRQALEVIGESF